MKIKSPSSLFPKSPARKLQQLLEQLSLRQKEESNNKLIKIYNQKRQRKIQIHSLRSIDILQPALLPTRHKYRSFSEYPPINKGTRVLNEKERKNIIAPDRIYNTQKNVLGGVPLVKRERIDEQDPEIQNRKFQEYNNIVDQQSGQVKFLKLKSHFQQTRYRPRDKYIRLKKTLFQKFKPSNYDFYRPIHPSQTLQSKTSGIQSISRSMKSISPEIIRDQSQRLDKSGEMKKRALKVSREGLKKQIKVRQEISRKKSLQSLQSVEEVRYHSVAKKHKNMDGY